jgi:hypothetical protein
MRAGGAGRRAQSGALREPEVANMAGVRGLAGMAGVATSG